MEIHFLKSYPHNNITIKHVDNRIEIYLDDKSLIPSTDYIIVNFDSTGGTKVTGLSQSAIYFFDQV